MSSASGLSEALNQRAPRKPRGTEPPVELELHVPTREQIKSGDTAILDAVDIVVSPKKPVRVKPAATTAQRRPAAASATAAEAATPQPRAPRRQAPARNASGTVHFKRALIPIMLTVGFVMLAPAVWGIAQLAGFEVPRFDDPKARRMALAMVATLPVSLGLIAGAVYMWVQTSRQLKAIARARQ